MQTIGTDSQSIGDSVHQIRLLPATGQKRLFRRHADASPELPPSVQPGYSPQLERYLTNESRSGA